jgi:hypothetical protein
MYTFNLPTVDEYEQCKGLELCSIVMNTLLNASVDIHVHVRSEGVAITTVWLV